MSFTVQTQPIDPKERRRQQDRERYAQMDSTQKELLKRRREARKKKNSSTSNKENEVPAIDTEWLSRNDNYERRSIHVPFQQQEIITNGMMATYLFFL